jgi:hypothetical protein
MFVLDKFDVRIQIVALIGAIVLVIGVVELVRRRRLSESYSIAWILLSLVIVVFALFRELQEALAALIGIYYPPSLIFGALIFMLLGVVLYLSVALTRLETQTRILAQHLALLEGRARLAAQKDPNDEPPAMA